MSEINRKIERLIKDWRTDLIHLVLTLAVLAYATFLTEKSDFAHSLAKGLEILFLTLGLYAVSVKAWRIRGYFQKQRKDRTKDNFRSLAECHKNALEDIGKKLRDKNGNVYSFSRVEEHELASLAELAHTAWDYGDDGQEEKPLEWRFTYMKKLFTINNEIFSFVRKDEEIIGYTSAIPMTSGDHFAGMKGQYTFDVNDIATTGGRSNLIYLQAIYIKQPFQDNRECDYLPYKAAVIGLFDSVATKLEPFVEVVKDGIDCRYNRGVLYAERFTLSGENVLRRWGFRKLSRQSASHEIKPLWELSMDYSNQEESFPRRDNALLTIRAINRLAQS